MGANKHFLTIAYILLVALGLSSCKDDRLFEAYKGMELHHWDLKDTVTFELDPISHKGSMIIAVKYADDYDFRNIYVRYLLKDSTNTIVENTLVNIPLFERTTGNPLGKGFGNTYTKYDTLPIQTDVTVSRVDFIQYMRVESLNGIEAIGLKIIANHP